MSDEELRTEKKIRISRKRPVTVIEENIRGRFAKQEAGNAYHQAKIPRNYYSLFLKRKKMEVLPD